MKTTTLNGCKYTKDCDSTDEKLDDREIDTINDMLSNVDSLDPDQASDRQLRAIARALAKEMRARGLFAK